MNKATSNFNIPPTDQEINKLRGDLIRLKAEQDANLQLNQKQIPIIRDLIKNLKTSLITCPEGQQITPESLLLDLGYDFSFLDDYDEARLTTDANYHQSSLVELEHYINRMYLHIKEVLD